jgi:CTP:molybdopterin cytidylyltransferase MocA
MTMCADYLRPAALILAAGAGRRLGTPKAQIEINGVSLLQRAVTIASVAGCSPVLAVVRSVSPMPEGALAVVNPDPDRGMGSSLGLALHAARELSEADRAVVLLVDMPCLDPVAVRRVLEAVTPDKPLAMARYVESRAHPVAFHRSIWIELLDFLSDSATSATAGVGGSGDRGARDFIAAHPQLLTLVDCSDLATPGDIDTADDLRRAQGGAG